MDTIRTENRGKFQFRLVRMKNSYAGVANRVAGGQIARIDGQDADDVWRRLLLAAGQASPDYFGFDGAVARFRQHCPAGFADPYYIAQERDYKDKARTTLDRTLPLSAVLQGRRGLGEPASHVFNATNLVDPREKMPLARFLRGTDADQFVLAAARFTADGGETALRDMSTILRKHDLAKWTIASYLPFFWRPGQHMFLKPEVTKDFATRVGDRFVDDYEAALNIGVYRSLLDLATRTSQELTRAGLPPHDNIDVQSFVWIVGKYGEAASKAAPERTGGASA